MRHRRRRLLSSPGRSGTPDGRFRRAVDGGGDAGETLASAAALGRPLSGTDALAVTLALAFDGPPLYERVAARLIARLAATDRAGAGRLGHQRIAVDALAGPPEPGSQQAALEASHDALEPLGRPELLAEVGRCG